MAKQGWRGTPFPWGKTDPGFPNPTEYFNISILYYIILYYYHYYIIFHNVSILCIPKMLLGQVEHVLQWSDGDISSFIVDKNIYVNMNHWRYTNADLKIFQYNCPHMKKTFWRFHIKTPFVFWDICLWDMWKVCFQIQEIYKLHGQITRD